jgi:hypothetical protein
MRQRCGLDWRRDSAAGAMVSGGVGPHGDLAGEAAGEWWGAAARGLCERRSMGRRGCASGAGCGLREKNQVAVGGGRLRGEAGQTTRRGREAHRGLLGHDGGRSVLGLGYMGLVGSNVFMGFISAGTLG